MKLLSYRREAGFTLIEILIVLGIMALVLTLIVGGFSVFKKSQTLDLDTQGIVETLEQARDETLASYNNSQYGVHITSTSTTLFAGSSYVSGSSTNIVSALNSADENVVVSLTGGGSDIIFNRLVGDTPDNGTITLSSVSTDISRTVTIYKTGLVSSN